jgi:DUF438 domain-containing protein
VPFKNSEYFDYLFMNTVDNAVFLYNQLPDLRGTYRGVLEMMQDATRIRELRGSKKLLDWNDGPGEE